MNNNMIIYKCDKCKNEIQGQAGGELVYIEETLIPAIKAEQPAQPSQRKVNLLLCKKCIGKVIKAAK